MYMCYNFIKIVENTLDKKNVWVRVTIGKLELICHAPVPHPPQEIYQNLAHMLYGTALFLPSGMSSLYYNI